MPISDALRRLGTVSAEYATRAQAFEGLADEAARAEALHRAERAKAIVWHKSSEDRMSMAEAEVRAEADEHVAALHLDRLVKAAAADAARAKLAQLKEQVAVGRSFAAAERASDEMHARSGV